MKLKYTLTLLSLLIGVYCGYSQTPDLTYSIIFGLDSDRIDLGIADNRKNIDELLNHMDKIYNDTTKVVSKILIDSYTSPEGGVAYNRELSLRRSNSLYNHISSRTKFNRNLYDIRGTGINWDLLTKMVEESNMEYKSEVLEILKYTPEETWKREGNNKWKTLVDSRNKQLMDLKGGVPYNYMRDNYFPHLRVGSALSVYYDQKYPTVDTVYVDKVDTVYKHSTEYIKVVSPVDEREKSLLLAVKTNLLSDLILIPNIEVEIPIGERYSVNGEFALMWVSDKYNANNWCHELQNYGIEGRYWFGDRSNRDQLSGLFGGVYLSRTSLDIQRKSDQGNQINIDYSVGLSGGYSLSLCRIFNLEFSAAVGYINGTSDKYTVNEERLLVRSEPTKEISTVFPTKAKVSLVWLINTKKR